MLLLPAVAAAKPPVVTMASGNKSMSMFDRQPLSRTWSWTCDDPDDNFPLQLRCLVYDVTKGTVGTGKEVKLSDTLCGSGSKDPIKVTHTYTVAAPKADHRYSYVAVCQDGKKFVTSAGPLFWYDVTAPSSIIHSGPPKVSYSSKVTFEVSCQDNSFGLTTAPKVPFVRCFNYTRVINTDTGQLEKPLSMPAYSTSSGMKIKQVYTYMAPGNYRFETYAKDEAGNMGLVKEWVWGIAWPDGGAPDAAVLVDTGPPKPDSKQAAPDKALAADLAAPADQNAGGGPDQNAGPKLDGVSVGEAGPGADLLGGDFGGGDLDGRDSGCDCRVGRPRALGDGLMFALMLLGVMLWRRGR